VQPSNMTEFRRQPLIIREVSGGEKRNSKIEKGGLRRPTLRALADRKETNEDLDVASKKLVPISQRTTSAEHKQTGTTSKPETPLRPPSKNGPKVQDGGKIVQEQKAGDVRDVEPAKIVPLKRPNYKAMTDEERRKYRKAFKQQFALLHALAPNVIVVPEITNESDLDELHDAYDASWKLSLEFSPFGKLRWGLVIFFLIVEFIGKKILGLAKFDGLATREIQKLNIYDPVLMEIGKKYSEAMGEGWCPEYRLAFFAVVSMLCYVVGAYLAQYFGEGVKSAFLTLSDGFVGMSAPGDDMSRVAEIVPNEGTHKTMGGLISTVMGMFGNGDNKAKVGEPAETKPKPKIALKRNVQR